ncbi:hypothetical protein CfE428DRAFT_5889 [Chthoniobacter flavus Ellin428]|uniref:Ribbon-helix-helix protein CopG domain-containing protein n=1 Tax=Chthoniobacter flavus Ellin428 TaxID=497964 RepID=B4DAE8_9BACT|nr:hypothetical protein [Chthoniobacter flavus]EDY16609.1 hypothetical protein CfE428DRAFT_5889 [Chthoniobacter flavus Ellin428]TCO91972.1 hypothetical protein EV701_107254 [Chthoniobacter flavus]
MKTLTVKIPSPLFVEIASAAKARKTSKSVIVRERLAQTARPSASLWDQMEDLVIEGDELPKDLSPTRSI